MTIYSFFDDLYSLDTLDTRFTTSAHAPVNIAREDSATLVEKDEGHNAQLLSGASPPRWRTPEFYFYALVFLVCVPQMYKAVWDVSQRMSTLASSHVLYVYNAKNGTTATSVNYSKYEHLLSDGWMLGRKVVRVHDQVDRVDAKPRFLGQLR